MAKKTQDELYQEWLDLDKITDGQKGKTQEAQAARAHQEEVENELFDEHHLILARDTEKERWIFVPSPF